MNTLKSLFLVITVGIATATSAVASAAPSAELATSGNVTGKSEHTSALMQFIERGQALRAADPVAYDNITGETNYAAQNPEFNVHGS